MANDEAGVARRKFEQLRANTAGASDVADASQSEARGALVRERSKVDGLERDLAEARQLIDALKASSDVTESTQARSTQARQLAETSDTLDRERERATSLVRDLEGARRERDTAIQELTDVARAFEEAWEQERDKARKLARLGSGARQDKALICQSDRDISRIGRAAKPRSAVRKSQRSKVKNLGERKLAGVTTIALPAALLPTRPPAKGFRQ